MLTTIVEQSAHLQPQGLQPQGLQPVSEHMSPHACLGSPAKADVAADELEAPTSRVSAQQHLQSAAPLPWQEHQEVED